MWRWPPRRSHGCARVRRRLAPRHSTPAIRTRPGPAVDGWRLSLAPVARDLAFRDDCRGAHGVRPRLAGQRWLLRPRRAGGLAAHGEQRPDGAFAVTLDGVRQAGHVLEHGAETRRVHRRRELASRSNRPACRAAGRGSGGRAADRADAGPGRRSCWSRPASTVRRGQPLMVIEAMKMEHTIAAPRDGTVETVRLRGRRPGRRGSRADRPRGRGRRRDPDAGSGRCRCICSSSPSASPISSICAGCGRRARPSAGGGWVYTRNHPRRADGGARRRLDLLGHPRPDPGAAAVTGFRSERDENGRRYCLIEVDPNLVATLSRSCRPFQGWRYLAPDARRRPIARRPSVLPLPDHMLAELRALGLI